MISERPTKIKNLEKYIKILRELTKAIIKLQHMKELTKISKKKFLTRPQKSERNIIKMNKLTKYFKNWLKHKITINLERQTLKLTKTKF